MEEERLKWLKNTIESNKEIRNKWLRVFGENNSDQLINRGAGIMWYDHERFALNSFFITKDIQQTKQHFFACGKIDEFLITNYDEKILDYGINHFSYALLSDNLELINRYSLLQHSNYEHSINNGIATPLYILQCFIKDDLAEYERVVPIMRAKTVKKFNMELDAEFFEALAERNKLKIEKVLSKFVTSKMHHERNRNYELVKEFISHPAIGYAKLAWIKGIEVEIISELVPQDLLPVYPLEKYDTPYVFLKNN